MIGYSFGDQLIGAVHRPSALILPGRRAKDQRKLNLECGALTPLLFFLVDVELLIGKAKKSGVKAPQSKWKNQSGVMPLHSLTSPAALP